MVRKKQERRSSAAAVGRAKVVEKQATEKGRDGRKEKQKGRGERKEKERGKEKGREEGDTAAAVGHRFFKVFFPEQSGERLKIPPPFQEYLEEDPNREVSLKGPSGNIWKVVLTSDSPGLGFTKGWKAFARDHSLVSGHFLLFTYDGCSQFSVAVFCASGVEDKSALNVQPSEEVVIKQEEEECVEDVDTAATSEGSDIPPVEGNETTRKRVRQVTPLEGNETTRKRMKQVTPVEGNETTKKRVRQVTAVMENCTSRKRHSSVQKKPEKKKPEAGVDTSKEAPTVTNSNKDEYSCYNKTLVKSKAVHRVGKLASKKSRQPVVISQRRLVTEEEKNNALCSAKEFKSKNPFAVQVMMDSYVYVGFFLNIPCEFVRESLPKTSKMMTLWDPQGKSWEVHYVYYNDRSVAAFSGGWGKFAVGNNLEKFDVCVFELFKEDNIKVHIYRVVPEITPLLRKSSV